MLVDPRAAEFCIDWRFPKAKCCFGCVNFADSLMLSIDDEEHDDNANDNNNNEADDDHDQEVIIMESIEMPSSSSSSQSQQQGNQIKGEATTRKHDCIIVSYLYYSCTVIVGRKSRK